MLGHTTRNEAGTEFAGNKLMSLPEATNCSKVKPSTMMIIKTTMKFLINFFDIFVRGLYSGQARSWFECWAKELHLELTYTPEPGPRISMKKLEVRSSRYLFKTELNQSKLSFYALKTTNYILSLLSLTIISV